MIWTGGPTSKFANPKLVVEAALLALALNVISPRGRALWTREDWRRIKLAPNLTLWDRRVQVTDPAYWNVLSNCRRGTNVTSPNSWKPWMTRCGRPKAWSSPMFTQLIALQGKPSALAESAPSLTARD